MFLQVTRPLIGGTWDNFNGDSDACKRYMTALRIKQQKEKEAAEFLDKLKAEDAAALLENTRIKELKKLEALRSREKRRLAAHSSSTARKESTAESSRSSTLYFSLQCPP